MSDEAFIETGAGTTLVLADGTVIDPGPQPPTEDQIRRDGDAMNDAHEDEDESEDFSLWLRETFHQAGKHDQSSHAGKTGAGDALGGAEVGELAQTSRQTRSKWGAGRDPDEINAALAVRGYTADDYKDINGSLRSRHPESAIRETRNKIRGMDYAIENAGVTSDRPVVVQRGLKRDVWDNMPHETGSVVIDDGYLSTTYGDRALYFASGRPTGVIVELTVPPGVRMLGGDVSDSELILGRGTPLRIDGTEMRPHPNRQEPVEYVLATVVT